MIIISQWRHYWQQGNPSTESPDTPNCTTALYAFSFNWWCTEACAYLQICRGNASLVPWPFNLLLCSCYMFIQSRENHSRLMLSNPPCVYFSFRKLPADALEGNTCRVPLRTKSQSSSYLENNRYLEPLLKDPAIISQVTLSQVSASEGRGANAICGWGDSVNSPLLFLPLFKGLIVSQHGLFICVSSSIQHQVSQL